MKAAITNVVALGLFIVATAGPATAQMGMGPYKGSDEFEQL